MVGTGSMWVVSEKQGLKHKEPEVSPGEILLIIRHVQILSGESGSHWCQIKMEVLFC